MSWVQFSVIYQPLINNFGGYVVIGFVVTKNVMIGFVVGQCLGWQNMSMWKSSYGWIFVYKVIWLYCCGKLSFWGVLVDRLFWTRIYNRYQSFSQEHKWIFFAIALTLSTFLSIMWSKTYMISNATKFQGQCFMDKFLFLHSSIVSFTCSCGHSNIHILNEVDHIHVYQI